MKLLAQMKDSKAFVPKSQDIIKEPALILAKELELHNFF